MTKKYVFYHICKNAGSSFIKGIEGLPNIRRASEDINHVRIVEYPPRFGETPLVIIRDPYSRFVSAFYHMNDISDPKHFYHDAVVSDFKTMKRMGIDFTVFKGDPNEFLKAFTDNTDFRHDITNKVLSTFDIFKSQFYWLRDGKNVYHNIRYLRYEYLNEDLKPIEIDIGSKITFPKDVNKRITKHVVSLTEKSKVIIRGIYFNDFLIL